jgi:hypothetical protein
MKCKTCGKQDSVVFDGECVDCAPPPFPREKDWRAMYQSCVKRLATKTSRHAALIERLEGLLKEYSRWENKPIFSGDIQQIIDEAKR